MQDETRSLMENPSLLLRDRGDEITKFVSNQYQRYIQSVTKVYNTTFVKCQSENASSANSFITSRCNAVRFEICQEKGRKDIKIWNTTLEKLHTPVMSAWNRRNVRLNVTLIFFRFIDNFFKNINNIFTTYVSRWRWKKVKDRVISDVIFHTKTFAS